jgi:hypothetical protein
MSATAQEILIAASAGGAFQKGEFDRDAFVRCVERKLNVSANRAVDLLVEAGLAKLEYPVGGGVHPRDAIDLWVLSVTPKGEEVMVASNHSLQARRP